MLYFCADDYGISAESDKRIVRCLKNGVLNRVSVLPNGEFTDFKQHFSDTHAELSLHINLVEGYPLSNPKDVDLLISENGCFKYSFIGLFFLSLSRKRKVLENQVYQEIQRQIRFWKTHMGEKEPVSINSHQHTHMIPLIFQTLLRVMEEEGLEVGYLRIPAEPILPYLLTPSLYLSYTPKGLIKQWLLRFLAFVNRKECKKSNIQPAYFMGAMFSGKLNETRLKALLPRYLKLAEKNDRDIEIGFHPGYLKNGEKLIDGSRKGFHRFYLSPWRKTEFDTLINLKF